METIQHGGDEQHPDACPDFLFAKYITNEGIYYQVK